ncbi:hypothetical protein [Amycolatopsis anabasis]|uniref:hypothetical protein n=1 Tax=Amycolatopsis anabasis TaxID=1840409 RepID=UPI00131D2E2C|nr:hypothetical protein [Amycolatopsis anabasis]
MHEPDLRRAAFGDRPAIPARRLAAAATGSARERLLTAIVLGARGSYAAAATLLGELAAEADPVPAALALAALASHRRQLGGHAAARGLDGAALALASRAGGPADPDGLDAEGALADAFLGLAADNLALGRIAAARRLRARAPAGGWRARVRAGWVGAEIELAAGDPAAAVAPAEGAVAEAAGRGARRHTVKSELVLAAALAAIGSSAERKRAAELVAGALAAADDNQLRSLSWPAGLLAADLFSRHAERYRFRASRVLHGVLLRSDPVGRRLADDSPWVPT